MPRRKMESSDEWNLKRLPGYLSRSPEEIRVLWFQDLPPDRDTNPALWDTLLGFFEDAAVSVCSQAGSLVITPRALLRQLKYEGREPSAGRAVILELFRRGDIVRADSLTLPNPAQPTTATTLLSVNGIQSFLKRSLWGSALPTPPSLDDPIVPTAALAAVAARAKAALGGPVSSDDIHTVQSFANALTNRNVHDAEAVIAHLVNTRDASILYTDVAPENPKPIPGFKLGSAAPSITDKGVLQTKAALERMEELSSHLEKSVEEETVAATNAARAGNKPEALARLRKKKLLDNKLAGARASALKLTDVLMAVDEAASNKEAVQALEIGMGSLRAANANGISAQRIDAIASDYAEAAADQEDIRAALQQLNQSSMGDTNAAEEAELEALLAAESVGYKLEVPSTDEEAELAKIMTELGIEKNDTVGLPNPPPIAEAARVKEGDGSAATMPATPAKVSDKSAVHVAAHTS
jgi:Snf7